MNIQEILSGIGNIFRDATVEYVYDECKAAKEYQKQKDIVATVAALCDIGEKKDKIYELLAKYFKIDSRAEAEEYYYEGKRIETFRRLVSYLSDNGYSPYERKLFMETNHVMDKLKNNPKLCELSTEKLKKAVEKG